MTSPAPKLLSFTNSIILREVMLLTFVTSFLITSAFSFYNAYNTYIEGEKEILVQVNAIEHALEPQLINALWDFNKESVKRMLQAFIENSNIARAEVVESDLNASENSGLKADGATLAYPLVINNKEGRKHLGILRIFISREHFVASIKDNIILMFFQNFIRFFITAACLIYMFNRMIVSPVRKIQTSTKEFNDKHLSEILGNKMINQSESKKNELEHLHSEIHLLQENFKIAFATQKQSEDMRIKIEIELEKEQQKKYINQRLEVIGQITSQVAHDFANLILIINGKAKILESHLSDADDLKQVNDIKTATGKSHALVKKLLSMTRMQKSSLAYFNPNQALYDINELLKSSVGGSIHFSIIADENDSLIHAEPSNFENVVMNLCINARDAMPEGGNIEILVESFTKEEKELTVVSVRDTGHGIPEEIQEKIFEPFFTTKSLERGSGLGLSQVMDFVKESKGTLELESSSGGTTFKLIFPNLAKENKFKLGA